MGSPDSGSSLRLLRNALRGRRNGRWLGALGLLIWGRARDVEGRELGMSIVEPGGLGARLTARVRAILTDIDCPLIGSTDDTTSGCKVHGTIAFEYCKTGVEEP